MSEEIYHIPSNIKDYKGQFIVFFSEENQPPVLFNSFFPEEAYQKAEEIKAQTGKDPVIIRVQDKIGV